MGMAENKAGSEKPVKNSFSVRKLVTTVFMIRGNGNKMGKGICGHPVVMKTRYFLEIKVQLELEI
jgi:hypothetical protein